jgi:hypothetical protein
MLRLGRGTTALAPGPIAGDAIPPVLPGVPMMLTQNINLPLGMFPIVIFTDLQALSMEPLSNYMDFQNTHAPASILSLLPGPEYILVEITEA